MALYGDCKGVVCLRSQNLVGGRLPHRALALVREWTEEHRDKLTDNWSLGANNRPLKKVRPLP